MNLKKYEGRKVRIIDNDDTEFVGRVIEYIYTEDNEPEGEGLILHDDLQERLIEFRKEKIKSVKILRKEKFTVLLFPPKEARFPGIIWFCDGCDECLSNQVDFNDHSDFWACTACGYVNSISGYNILNQDLFNAVKNAVDKWDPYLVFPDAPEDEYDDESRMILAKIGETCDESIIAAVVATVFSSQFGEHFSKEECEVVAKRIKSNIEHI